MSTEPPDVVLYVRSLAPRGNADRLRDVRESLDRLDEAGAIADHEVTVWGEAVPIEGDHPLSRQVDRFAEWARVHDATLPGVDERVAGTLADETRSVVTLPRIALGEYRDGDLQVVTPHERDGVVHTVEDRLDALGTAGGPEERRAAARSD